MHFWGKKVPALLFASSVILGKPLLCASVSSTVKWVDHNGTPLQYSCLENPMDGGALQAAVHGVTKSRTQLSDFTFTFHFHALEKEMATHSSVCLENPRDVGARWAAIYGVAQSQTRLKQLGSSSRIKTYIRFQWRKGCKPTGPVLPRECVNIIIITISHSI